MSKPIGGGSRLRWLLVPSFLATAVVLLSEGARSISTHGNLMRALSARTPRQAAVGLRFRQPATLLSGLLGGLSYDTLAELLPRLLQRHRQNQQSGCLLALLQVLPAP